MTFQQKQRYLPELGRCKSNAVFRIFIIGFLLLINSVGISQKVIVVENWPEKPSKLSGLFIAGDFQGWDPGHQDFKLTYDSIRNIYSINLDIEFDDIQFKFTQGSWEIGEGRRNGSAIPNRKLNLSTRDSFFLSIKGWEKAMVPAQKTRTRSSNVHVLSDSFYITSLDRFRRIWIYLPPDYNVSVKKYPVLYAHDAQNLFDESTSYAGEWKIDETLNELYDNNCLVPIVIGIDNGGDKRIEEYTPWETSKYGGGKAKDYLSFIINELKPFVDSEYRTLKNNENTGIMGSSLGGLVSTYAGLEYPEIFGKICSFSPSYWINPEIMEFIQEMEEGAGQKWYQIMGEKEGKINARLMIKVNDLLVENAGSYEGIFSEIIKEGEHNEQFWAQEFKAAYLWLFEPECMNK